MSKLTIGTIPIDMIRTNVVECRVKAPARVIGGFIAYKQASVLLVRDKHTEPVAIPHLVVEFDPDAELVERRYVGVTVGMAIDSDDPVLGGATLRLAHVFVNPNDGKPMAVYEAVPIADDRPAPVSGEIGAAT